MRCLHVRNGKVVNVVEYPGTPPETDGDDLVVPAVTGIESIDDNFDEAAERLDRSYNKIDLVVGKELFRLTNAVRALQSQTPLSAAQYKAFIKTLF